MEAVPSSSAELGAVGEKDVDPTRHWEGQLFVFDDRLVVPVDGVVGGQRDRADSR